MRRRRLVARTIQLWPRKSILAPLLMDWRKRRTGVFQRSWRLNIENDIRGPISAFWCCCSWSHWRSKHQPCSWRPPFSLIQSIRNTAVGDVEIGIVSDISWWILKKYIWKSRYILELLLLLPQGRAQPERSVYQDLMGLGPRSFSSLIIPILWEGTFGRRLKGTFATSHWQCFGRGSCVSSLCWAAC